MQYYAGSIIYLDRWSDIYELSAELCAGGSRSEGAPSLHSFLPMLLICQSACISLSNYESKYLAFKFNKMLITI